LFNLNQTVPAITNFRFVILKYLDLLLGTPVLCPSLPLPTNCELQNCKLLPLSEISALALVSFGLLIGAGTIKMAKVPELL